MSLAAELEFDSYLLQRLVDRVLPAAIADIIVAFEARAHRLHDVGRPIQNAPPT